MKKLIYILLVFTIICSSCVQDVDDVYDAPVAQRVEQAVQEYQTLLRSAEYGWLMEYYPSPSQSYGGYLYVMKFVEGDKVIVSTDAFGKPQETAESLYSIKKDMGPTLNFDSYNALFSYFSDPDITDEAGGSGKGYEGDYEFLLRSHTENEIILRGKKTKNMIRMTRLTGPGVDVLTKSTSISQKMFAVYYTVEIAGEPQTVFMQERNFTVTLPTAEGMTVEQKWSYLITDTGLKLYAPVEVSGKKVQNFVYDAVTQSYNCIDEGMESLKIKPAALPEGYMHFDDFIGSWKMTDYDNNTYNIQISKKFKDDSFYMKGLNANFTVMLYYNYKLGRIEWPSQLLQTTGDGTRIWFCAWDAFASTSLSGNTSYRLIGEPKADAGKTTIEWTKNNGTWSGKTGWNSFILWKYPKEGSSSEYKDWGQSRYRGGFTMIKD